MTSPVLKKTLANGLVVMLKEIHTAPIISHWVWYRVGSRNEVQGSTGISHWVEHMQFKGTPRFPAGYLDKAIARTGGAWNAFTHLDWTTYYETLPADQIDLALQLEVDRMSQFHLRPGRGRIGAYRHPFRIGRRPERALISPGRGRPESRLRHPPLPQ